ncbi:MAG: AAA family ATPase [Bacteroidetes bacterium]|nr:AAA family ATPase [Bacteroidota bacterium]MBU1679139.1 AAA family ATPase [Bacteroidota bacterium]MBU2507398.1 AAA family ATPase [Bacteroidota bacterium]
MALLKAAKAKELSPDKLRWTCDPKSLTFDSTEDLKSLEGIIGQERAIKALKLGVDMRSQGYNIFITGLSGTGKFTTVKKMLETISPDCTPIYDYAYVNNFEDQDRPILLEFPAGQGNKFKKDMESAISFLQENIPQVLENEPFVRRRKKLLEEHGISQQELMLSFEEKLRKNNFTLGQVKMGEAARPEILPVIDNEPVLIQKLDELIRNNKITKQKATALTKKYAQYQEDLKKVFRQSLQLNQDFKSKLENMESQAVEDIVSVTLESIKKKYKIEKVIKYLDKVFENILQNLDVFKGAKPQTEETVVGVIVDYLKEYEVNIIMDNSKVTKCPVIIETSPTFSNLFGAIEKYSDGSGGWYADFTKIKAGTLLRANGGYLVLNAVDAYSEPGVWKVLKRVLLYGKLEIQDMTSAFQFSPSVLKPEPIEINTKILFVGNNYIYSLLSAYEDDFNKIFKVKADFDYEMKRTDSNIVEYAKVIKKIIDSEKLIEFDSSAIAKIIEYSARYAGQQNKLTTRFAYVADIARESCFWAKDNGANVVTSYDVTQAYEAARERHGLYESKLTEMINKGIVLIDTEGSRVGQINGLAVFGSDSKYSFGKPTRITASVSLGNGSIVNVERESGLSGNTHNKGVLIITGYLRDAFGRKIPLSFNASLVFEQGYGMIDGDSASITEICALLSCLSNIPIKQNYAITGSVNQKGDIQPIGGVNEKIEGFFDICKKRGLAKDQGVIIPIQNVSDLMLKEEIIAAVEKGVFKIMAVSRVEEAVEILMGVKAGKIMKNGFHQPNTVFGEVEKTLRDMHSRLKPKSQINKTESLKPKRKRKSKKIKDGRS